MLHISRYGTRLAEEKRKKERRKKMNIYDFRPFQVYHFKQQRRIDTLVLHVTKIIDLGWAGSEVDIIASMHGM